MPDSFFSLAVQALAAVPPDVVGTASEEAVTAMVDLGIATGYPDGSFGVNDNIKREAVAAMVVNLIGCKQLAGTLKDKSYFNDVPAGYWAAGSINVAFEKSIMSGSNGNFRPSAFVTYQEVITTLLRAMGYGPEVAANGMSWPNNYLSKAGELKLVDTGMYNSASDLATRGNVAKLFWSALNKQYITEDGSLSENTLLEDTFPDKYFAKYRKEKTVEQISKNVESTVLIKTYPNPEIDEYDGHGSGVVIRDGLIVTNAHVVGASPRYGILYNDTVEGSEYKTSGTLFYSSYISGRDVAIIDSPKSDAKPVRLGNSDALRIGQKVVAISSPEKVEYKNTVSEGVISNITTIDGNEFIQFTAAVSSGSSGGALFDMYGDLIGIITLKDFNGESINMAIPINEAITAIDDTSIYNYDLNKQLLDQMQNIKYNRKDYNFSCDGYYSENTEEYRVNFFMYDESEGAQSFGTLYRSSESFQNLIAERLEKIHELIDTAEYDRYMITLTVKDKVLSYRIDNGEKIGIKNNFSTITADISYDDYEKTLQSKYSLCNLSPYSFSFYGMSLYESTSNSTYLNLTLYVNDMNFRSLLAFAELGDANQESFEQWIKNIAKEVSDTYPDKTVQVNVSLAEFFNYEPTYYYEDYWSWIFEPSAQDPNWFVYRPVLEVYDVILDEYQSNWMIDEPDLED